MAFVATPTLASADSGSGTAALSTDHLSYSPGGIVDLSGAGFAAGDAVTVTLADSLTGTTIASADVTVASDGTFTGVYMTLPPDFSASLRATATDAATGDTTSIPVAETLTPASFIPTITTDQQDYAPGSVVTITGSGWPADDSLSVFTNDSAGSTWSETDQVTTDSNGAFTDRVTLPLMFIANYSVNATDANGLSATTSFTDGNVQTATVDVRNAPTPCTVSNTTFNIGDTVCAHSTIGTVTGSGNGSIFVQWVNPSGNKVGSAVAHAGNTGDTFDDTLSLTSASPTGTWKVEVCTNSSCPANQVKASQTFTVGLGTTTTVASSGSPSTYGSSVTFTATVTASTNPAAHGSVTFKDGTTAICSNVALDGSSQATCSTSALPAIGSPHSVTAVYSGATSGGTTWNGSTSSAFSQAVSQKALTVTGITASDKVYDGSTSATIDTGAAALVGVVSGDSVTLNKAGATGAFLTNTAGSGKTVQISGLTITGTGTGNYTLTQPSTTASITAKGLTVSGAVANNKQYDSTASATVDFTGAALVGAVGNDTVSLDTTGYSAHFADKNVGDGKTVTVIGVALTGSDSGNYTVAQPTGLTANITAKTLTVNGAIANNKQYDATTAATVNFGGASLVGVFTGDNVSIDSSGYSAHFADKDVGNGKTVTVTGVGLGGSDSGNYTVFEPSGLTADITTAPLDISAVTDSKTYDGTTSSTGTPTVGMGQLQGTDSVTGRTQAFQSKDVLGTNGSTLVVAGYTVNDGNGGDNYAVQTHTATGTIAALDLTISGAVAQDKTYNGTAEATVDFSLAQLDTPISGDDVSIDSADYAAHFDNKHVGTNKPVTVTGVALSGSDSGNYTVSQPTDLTANIGAENLTIDGAKAEDKTYDSSDHATVDWTAASLPGVVSGDDVSLDTTGYSAHFADKNVGGGKPVTVTGVTLDGSDAADYTVSQPSGLAANITKAPLDISAVSDSKTYDGNKTSTGTPTVSGLQGTTDSVADPSQAFQSKDVLGTDGSTLTVTGYTVRDGNEGANYEVTTHTAAGTITQASLDIYAVTDSKTYDGNKTSTGTPTVSGLQGGDTVTNSTQAFQSKNVLGVANSTLVVSTYTVDDGNFGGNYNIATHIASGTITARPITVTAQPDTKTYDTTTSSTVAPQVTAGSIAGGDTGNFTQAFATRTVGSNKTLIPSGSVSDTNSGNNYSVTFTNNTNGVINPATLTVTGITANNKVWDGTTTAALNTGGASLAGVLANDSVTLNTGGAIGTFSTSNVGTWPVSVSGLTITGNDSDNYMLLQPSTTASISAWNAAGKGFYAPVGVANSIFTAAPAGPPAAFSAAYVWNTVKSGQTVPLKFNVFAGSVEQTGASTFTNIATAFQAAKMTSCTSLADTDPVDYTIAATGSTTLRYDPTGMQWIYNWQTPKVSTTTCYRTYVTFADGSSIEAFFQLSK